jgi:hypothetical protein
MWALHAGFLAEEVSPTVPAPVVAEAWRGGSRRANLTRMLALCTVEAMDDRRANPSVFSPARVPMTTSST